MIPNIGLYLYGQWITSSPFFRWWLWYIFMVTPVMSETLHAMYLWHYLQTIRPVRAFDWNLVFYLTTRISQTWFILYLMFFKVIDSSFFICLILQSSSSWILQNVLILPVTALNLACCSPMINQISGTLWPRNADSFVLCLPSLQNFISPLHSIASNFLSSVVYKFRISGTLPSFACFISLHL